MSASPQQGELLGSVPAAAGGAGFALPRERLEREMWLAARLKEHGVNTVFAGVTDHAVRRERFRTAILEHGVEMVMACKNDNEDRQACTYAEAFASIYGEPLELQASKRTKRSKPAPPVDDDDIAF